MARLFESAVGGVVDVAERLGIRYAFDKAERGGNDGGAGHESIRDESGLIVAARVCAKVKYL